MQTAIHGRSFAMDAIDAVNSRLDWRLPYPDLTSFCATSAAGDQQPDVRRVRTPGRVRLQEAEKTMDLHTPRRPAAGHSAPREYRRQDGPPKHRLYRHQYPSDHTLRLPDVLKRLFAPPNCFFPAVHSPGRPAHPSIHRPQSTATPAMANIGNATVSSQRERMIDTAVRKTLPRATARRCGPRTKRSTPGAQRILPWMSVDSFGFTARQPCMSPPIEPQRWSGLAEWQARGPIQSPYCSTLKGSIANQPVFGRSMSLYSSVPSTCCLSLKDDCNSGLASPGVPTLSLDQQLHSASMEELLVNQDIEAFLQGRWRPDPARS